MNALTVLRCSALVYTLLAASVSGGEPSWAPLTTDGDFKQRPDWSPDGKRLLFTRHRNEELQLIELTVATKAERRLTKSEETEQDGVWSPDASEVAFTFNKPQPNQSDVEVYRLRVDAGTVTPVAVTGDKLSHEEYPSWSPDGKKLVFTSTRDGNQEVYIVAAEGGDWTRITSDPAHDAHPVWSPRGDAIAFATDRWGDLEIAVIDPEGSTLRRLTASKGIDDFPSWSPDGQQLAFSSNRDGNREIYVVAVGDGTVERKTFHDGIDDFPAWTPDGRLTCISQRDGAFDVYVEVKR